MCRRCGSVADQVDVIEPQIRDLLARQGVHADEQKDELVVAPVHLVEKGPANSGIHAQERPMGRRAHAHLRRRVGEDHAIGLEDAKQRPQANESVHPVPSDGEGIEMVPDVADGYLAQRPVPDRPLGQCQLAHADVGLDGVGPVRPPAALRASPKHVEP